MNPALKDELKIYVKFLNYKIKRDEGVSDIKTLREVKKDLESMIHRLTIDNNR